MPPPGRSISLRTVRAIFIIREDYSSPDQVKHYASWAAKFANDLLLVGEHLAFLQIGCSKLI